MYWRRQSSNASNCQIGVPRSARREQCVSMSLSTASCLENPRLIGGWLSAIVY